MNLKHLFSLILPIIIFILVSNSLYAFFGPIGPTELVMLLLILFVIAIIFLIFRQVTCWYWKINEIVSLLKDVKENINSVVEYSREHQNDYTKKDNRLEEVKEKTDAEKAAETEKKKEAEAKREAEFWEEHKKKRDDDFLKY